MRGTCWGPSSRFLGSGTKFPKDTVSASKWNDLTHRFPFFLLRMFTSQCSACPCPTTQNPESTASTLFFRTLCFFPRLRSFTSRPPLPGQNCNAGQGHPLLVSSLPFCCVARLLFPFRPLSPVYRLTIFPSSAHPLLLGYRFPSIPPPVGSGSSLAVSIGTPPRSRLTETSPDLRFSSPSAFRSFQVQLSFLEH